MNYEEKYKQAFKKALELYNQGLINPPLEHIFPELKESEDERIRKELIAFIKKRDRSGCDYDYDKWLAWLEKQGENKPTDKVESKFHEGEWIIHQGTENIYQVTARIDNQYQLKYGDNYTIQKCADVDRCARLWTIQDAKDGDVLVYVTDEEDLWIMIYWFLYVSYDGHVHYHALLVNDNFTDKGTCCICIDNLKPATKEQRDLLFQKMADAGYEWDAEKKELKKIKSKTLDADKVIKWFRVNWWDSHIGDPIDKFKKDFGL